MFLINPLIELIGQYTKSYERILVRCKKCGYEWNPYAYSLLSGRSCPHCSAKKGAINRKGQLKLKTQNEFIQEMKQKNPLIEIIGDYANNKTKIKCKCLECDNHWDARPDSLLQGHGCPRCAKSGTSFMEQMIKNSFVKVLGNDNVIHRDKVLIGMELDIYIPSLHIAFEPGNWHLHSKSVKRDSQKRERCKMEGVKLITVYDRFPINMKPPFEDDCYVFKEDLNQSDHNIIRKFIYELFNIAHINKKFTNKEWEEIENESYKLTKAQTHIDFINRLTDKNPNVEILSTYKNMNDKMLVKCKTCGNMWTSRPADLLCGYGCKKCGTKVAHQKMLKDKKFFIEQVKLVNPNVEIVGEYQGRHHCVRTKCKICGYEWDAMASSLLRGSNHKGWQSAHKRLEVIS